MLCFFRLWIARFERVSHVVYYNPGTRALILRLSSSHHPILQGGVFSYLMFDLNLFQPIFWYDILYEQLCSFHIRDGFCEVNDIIDLIHGYARVCEIS